MSALYAYLFIESGENNKGSSSACFVFDRFFPNRFPIFRIFLNIIFASLDWKKASLIEAVIGALTLTFILLIPDPV